MDVYEKSAILDWVLSAILDQSSLLAAAKRLRNLVTRGRRHFCSSGTVAQLGNLEEPADEIEDDDGSDLFLTGSSI